MKKIKLISTCVSIGALSSFVAPISMLTGCSCSKTIKVVETSKLDIQDGVLKGFKEVIDVSAYDKLSIPRSVTKIAVDAFKNMFTVACYENGANNNIKEIKLPKTIKYIEPSAFEGCNGIEVLDLTDFNETELNNLQFPIINDSEGNNAFKEWKDKGKILLNNNISDSSKKKLFDLLVFNGLNILWTNDDPAPTTSKTHIVSINDFHGAAPGFGDDFFNTNQLNAGAVRLAQETQEIMSKYPGSTFLSCGDYNAGESFSTCKQAETLYPVLKEMGVQYSAVGNHAWEWGGKNLINKHWDSLARTNQTKGNYFVTSNILNDAQYREKTWCVDETNPQFSQDYTLWKTNRIKWADPYKVLDMNGHDVCLIGLTTHDTLTDGNLNAIADLSFMKDYNASVTYAKKLAKEELKDDFNKIESFILLTHCTCQPDGGDATKIQPDGECAVLAKNATTDFDAIFGAHSHHVCSGTIKNTKTGKDICIAQAGQSGRNYTDATLTFDDSKPVGQRFKSITMEVKTPKIDGQDLNPVLSERKPDKALGLAQMKKIVEKTIYPMVRNTNKVYEEQKNEAKKELDVVVGRIAHEGLPYYYTDNTERSFGTQYMESETLVEPAGVFAQVGQIVEFIKEYCTQIIANKLFAPCVAINNLDSFKNGISLAPGQSSRDVSKNEFFSMNAFENNIIYGCLTPGQLRQYINYFLEGACKFNYLPKVAYPIDIYLDDNKQEKMVFSDKDEKDVYKKIGDTEPIAGVSYVSGPNQFYGMSFKVKLVEERTEEETQTKFKVYQLDDNDELKIFDPTNETNHIYKPDTWTPINDFIVNTDGYIPITISSFTHQGGNAQNRMLKHWFTYNENKEKTDRPEVYNKIKSRKFSLLTRDAIIRYTTDLTSIGYDLDKNINQDLLNKLIVKPA